MAKSRTKNCKVCGGKFNLYAHKGRKEQECCSRKCSGLLARKRVECVCQTCGKTFFVPQSHFGTKHTGKFCSIACTHEAFKNGTFIYRKKSGPNPGRYVDPQGYVHVVRNKKRQMEHRWEMSRILGRPLKRYETVHHKNGDRADNRPENLEIWIGRHPTGTSSNHYAEEIKGLRQRIEELEFRLEKENPMSIGNDSKQVLLTKDSNTTALKNTTKYIYPFDACTVFRVQAYVDVVVDAEMTITITREAIIGGTSTAITTLTVPNTTAVGKVVYKDITPVDLAPGQVLKYVVSNTGTSTAMILSAVVIPRAEMAVNMANMVLSA